MIYEMRTYDIIPQHFPAAIKRFGEAYEHCKQYVQLGAFWYTMIGPLKQLIYVWPHKDLADRGSKREVVSKDSHWPPRLAEYSVAQRSEILISAPGSPELQHGKVGPYFEMRIYTLAPGELPLVMENWEKALPKRNALKPACGVWYTDIGVLDKWIVIWPFESFAQRTEIREKARATGDWPPSALARKEGRKAAVYTARENKILQASAFSPVQ